MNYALAGRRFDYSLGLTDCTPYETTIVVTSSAVSSLMTKMASPGGKVTSSPDVSSRTKMASSGNRMTSSVDAAQTNTGLRHAITSSNNASLLLGSVMTSPEMTSRTMASSRSFAGVGRRAEVVVRMKRTLSRYCKRAYLKNGLKPPALN